MGLTQQQAAEKLGVPFQSVSKWECGVVEKGTYILTASIAGICSREKVIDGSRIEEGDV